MQEEAWKRLFLIHDAKTKEKSKDNLTTEKEEIRPDKQAITGNRRLNDYDFLPALQVKQVKRGCFKAIYEDNVWKLKLNSNDQNWKNMIEFLFLV